MPLYEYQCQSCGRTLEKRQKFSDDALTECPQCGGRLEKLISAPAVQFKGGGWFADGYGSSKGTAKSGGSDAATTANSSSTASEGSSSSSSKTPSTPSMTSASTAPSAAPSTSK